MAVKVCHISTVHPYNDVRVFFKECKSLANEGYDVYYIVPYDKSEIIDNVKIVPLSLNNSRLYRVFVKGFSAFNKAIKINADIYHFHDPELISIGFLLKLFGKKVVYDVHEDVPAQILNKKWLGNITIRKIISGLFNIYEKTLSRCFNGIVTVTYDIAEKFSFNKNITVVSNYPEISEIKRGEKKTINKDKFAVIYAGAITKIRGIEEVIDAIEILNGDVELWLLGNFESNELKAACEKKKGWKYTRYFGSMKVYDVYGYMKNADAGLCTLYPSKNYLRSWPIKAFEYMACGLPIIMSDFPYWKELFGENALFVNPKDPVEIAEKIQLLKKDVSYSKLIGEKNKKVAEEKYSFEEERKKLFKLYNKIK